MWNIKSFYYQKSKKTETIPSNKTQNVGIKKRPLTEVRGLIGKPLQTKIKNLVIDRNRTRASSHADEYSAAIEFAVDTVFFHNTAEVLECTYIYTIGT